MRDTATGICRSFWNIRSLSSDRDQLAVLSEGHAEPVADLAERGVGFHGVDDRWYQVVLGARRPVECVHRRRPAAVIALEPKAADAVGLIELGLRVDPLQWRRHAL